MKSMGTDKLSDTAQRAQDKAPATAQRRSPAPADIVKVEARAEELARQEKWKQAARALMQAAKAEPATISTPGCKLRTWQRQSRAP
jgi:hypothetical protein